MKYIVKRENGYAIQKVINKKLYSFGLYNTLEEARHYRDYFIENNWDMKERLKFSKRKNKNKKEPKNIYKTCHEKSKEKYEISQEINGHKYHFGSYYTLEEAIKWRDYFESTGWQINERLIGTCVSNIKQTSNGNYIVYRRIGKKEVYYGVFHRLEDAQEEVKILRKCNWDYSEMECIDERKNNETTILDGITIGTSFLKKNEMIGSGLNTKE